MECVENGIWLCQNCAHLIDAVPERYPVTLLDAWKEKTETEARTSIGKRSGMSSEEMLLLAEAESVHPCALSEAITA